MFQPKLFLVAILIVLLVFIVPMVIPMTFYHPKPKNNTVIIQQPDSKKIPFENINVDHSNTMNRIEIPQGWIIRAGNSTFFIPDSNHIWKLEK